MNIFEFLGLDPNHRKLTNKVTQLVKHFDEVVETHKKGKTFGIQLKVDGCCSLTVVGLDGAVGIFSRTGNLFTNTQFMVNRFQAYDVQPGVYMGELYVPKDVASLEEFSGCINPNRNKALGLEMSFIPELMELALFDYITLDEFVAGESSTKYINRWENLVNRMPDMPNVGVLDYVIASEVQHHKIDTCLEQAVDDGEEGVVIRDMTAGWEAGHKGWRVMKKVRGVDYDLTCIAWEEGTGKYKEKVANLIFAWKDNMEIKAMLGRGWTHEMAAEMFLDATHSTGESPVGKVFQVYALEESSKGKLRLPKVGERRHDKDEADV